MSLFRARAEEALAQAQERFLSSDACRDLLARAQRFCSGGGDIQLQIRSRWAANVRWARNEITSAGDKIDHDLWILRRIAGANGTARTNQVDDESLRECLRRAESQVRFDRPDVDAMPLRKAEKYLATNVWSDATFQLTAADRARLQTELAGPARAEGLHSAGFMEMSATGHGVVNTEGHFAYAAQTRAEYSVTVRNARGTASGWAGLADKDWRTIDAQALSAVAMDKCRKSADPVGVEPARYTAILEPQAVADLVKPLVGSLHRPPAEMGIGPWADRQVIVPMDLSAGAGMETLQQRAGGGSRIGQQVMDKRITISMDPADPEASIVPFYFDGTPMRPVQWIEAGVLRELAYSRNYAVRVLNKPHPLNISPSFRMSGGTTSLEDMIKATERGILVTRLVNVREVDHNSLLQAGTTADGLFLVERGKVTRALKNFRFRDSPLFALNSFDLIGPPVRVFADLPTIVPPIRVRDFSFTSTADAV